MTGYLDAIVRNNTGEFSKKRFEFKDNKKRLNTSSEYLEVLRLLF